MKPMTHTGRIEHSIIGKRVVRLRATKAYWLTEHGEKFRKSDGKAPGSYSTSRWTLKLETLKPI
jgi:hypothetical protein